MSTICLVTKLKSVVDNSNLIGLDELRVTSTSAGSINCLITRGDDKPFNLKTTEGCYIYKSDLSGFYHDIPNCQESDNIRYYIEFGLKGDGYAIFPDKSKIQSFIVRNVIIEDVNDLMYFHPIISKLIISDSTINKGSLKDINKYNLLEKISINSVKGVAQSFDIDEYATLYRLTELLVCPGMYGDIESFVATQASGSSAKTMSLGGQNYTAITINNQPVKTVFGTGRLSISFDGSGNATISYDNVVKATYNNGSWTYNI